MFESRKLFIPLAIRLAVLLAGMVLLFGFGNQDAFAKCGNRFDGPSWMYASTAELLAWDGRWWANDPLDRGFRLDSHANSDSRPCSHCSGRPVEDAPVPVPVSDLRVAGPIVVIESEPASLDRQDPPSNHLVLVDDFLLSRTLEVAKRPPKVSL